MFHHDGSVLINWNDYICPFGTVKQFIWLNFICTGYLYSTFSSHVFLSFFFFFFFIWRSFFVQVNLHHMFALTIDNKNHTSWMCMCLDCAVCVCIEYAEAYCLLIKYTTLPSQQFIGVSKFCWKSGRRIWKSFLYDLFKIFNSWLLWHFARFFVFLLFNVRSIWRMSF